MAGVCSCRVCIIVVCPRAKVLLAVSSARAHGLCVLLSCVYCGRVLVTKGIARGVGNSAWIQRPEKSTVYSKLCHDLLDAARSFIR